MYLNILYYSDIYMYIYKSQKHKIYDIERFILNHIYLFNILKFKYFEMIFIIYFKNIDEC